MAKKLAIVVTHGIGTAPKDFDKALKGELRQRVGSSLWRDIHWIPVHWSPVLTPRQDKLSARMKKRSRWNWVRGFVIDNLSDASAYQYKGRTTARHKVSAYYEINDRFYQALKKARTAGKVDDNTHVICIAQSMGCHVLSNYIWDMSTEPRRVTDETVNPFVRMDRLSGFFMTGCNIPLLLMAFAETHQVPIKVPGAGVTFAAPEAMWETYFDKDDLLGYPLRPTYATYYAGNVPGFPFDAAKEVKINDNTISSGGLISGMTPYSHTQYWEDSEFLDPLEAGIRKIHALI